jgi:tetratricopeptide (TPR) repeat protein
MPPFASPCSSLVSRVLASSLGACCLTTSSLVVPALAPALAVAAPADESEQRALAAYREGQEAYDAGRYDEALELFLEAQSFYPSPDFHYNIGKCHEALENYEQAAISYKAYLRSYKSAFDEDPQDEANIQNKIDRLEKQVEADKAAAEAAANKQPEVIIQTVPAEKPPKPGLALIITGGVLAGVGVGAVGVGAGLFGPRAADFSRQLDQVYTGGNPERVTLDEARQLDIDGRAAQRNQILLISVGAALAVTGVALLVVGVNKKKQGPSAVVTPTAGPEGAGLVIQGRF